MSPARRAPETVLQFGAGRFLRAFFDLFIDEANAAGSDSEAGHVVVVQSTPGPRAELLEARGGVYHVALRGIADGERVDRTRPVESISRALVAATEWDEVLRVARSPDLRVIVSNTTERGYELDPVDLETGGMSAPTSFPARLLDVLRSRFEAGLDGVTILPCELLERNAKTLRAIVDDLAARRGLDGDLRRWIGESCRWHDNLVDRIVTGPSATSDDPLLTIGEPFALFVVETVDGALDLFEHPAILPVDDVAPYALRKVRILNGAHTALVARALPAGFETVRAAVLDPEIGGWLRRLLFDEIVPAIDARVDDAELFARQVLERFENPFLEHRLADIALHHEDKLLTRLAPTRDEYAAAFGETPELLSQVCPAI